MLIKPALNKPPPGVKESGTAELFATSVVFATKSVIWEHDYKLTYGVTIKEPESILID